MFDSPTVLDWIGLTALFFFGGLAGLLGLFIILLPQLVTFMCLTALFSPQVYGDSVVYPHVARGIIFMGSWFAACACFFLWLVSLDSSLDITPSIYGLVAWGAHTIGVYVGIAHVDAPVPLPQPGTASSPTDAEESGPSLTIDHQQAPFRYASWDDEE